MEDSSLLDFIDIRTLSFVSSIISLVLCICMIYISKTRKTYNGFTQWTVAAILYSVGMVFLSLRGILPDFISIIGANALIIAGSAAIAYGLELFTNSARRMWLYVFLIISMILLCLYFTYSSPDVSARIIIISTIIAILYGYSGHLVHTYVPRLINDRNRFLVVVFSLQAIWSGLRVIHAFFIGNTITEYINVAGFFGITVFVFFCGNILMIIGLIVLNFQKVEFDLRAATEEVRTLRGIIPICSSCKKIRDDQGIWKRIEAYIQAHSEAEFSHGICPECMNKLYPEMEEQDNH